MPKVEPSPGIGENKININAVNKLKLKI